MRRAVLAHPWWIVVACLAVPQRSAAEQASAAFVAAATHGAPRCDAPRVRPVEVRHGRRRDDGRWDAVHGVGDGLCVFAHTSFPACAGNETRKSP
eukprot:6771483-Prymnesium_polylepis.1